MSETGLPARPRRDRSARGDDGQEASCSSGQAVAGAFADEGRDKTKAPVRRAARRRRSAPSRRRRRRAEPAPRGAAKARRAPARGRPRSAPARLQPAVAQSGATDRRRRQGARRLFQAARKRRFRPARRRHRPHGGDARPDRRILPLRRPAGARRPGRAVAPVSRFVGLDLAPAAGRGRGAGRRAGPRRQALRPSRMARQSLFRLPQAGLCADDPLGQGSRRARRRARPGDAPQGAVLSAATDERAVAVELRPHQSRAAAHDARRERRQPGARPENDGRGHRRRRRKLAHPPCRRVEVHARRQPRRDAGQGRLSQRPDRTHPVRADDRDACSSGRC